MIVDSSETLSAGLDAKTCRGRPNYLKKRRDFLTAGLSLASNEMQPGSKAIKE